MLPVLKEKLNYLQTNEEILENNSMIQEIQDSEMFSKVEESRNDEYVSVEREENQKQEFEKENENFSKIQTFSNLTKTADFLTQNENDRYDRQERLKSLGENSLKNEFREETSNRNFLKQKAKEENDREIEINLNERIDQRIDEKMKHFMDVVSEDERKIKLLERRLMSFEEVKIKLNDNFFEKKIFLRKVNYNRNDEL